MSTIGSPTQTISPQLYRIPHCRRFLIFSAILFLLQVSVLILHMQPYSSRRQAFEACLKIPNVIPASYVKPSQTAHHLIVAGTFGAMAGLQVVMYSEWRTRLDFSPEQVVYDSGLFRIRTVWDNVAGIFQAQRRRGGPVDYLLLHEPGLDASPLTAWLAGSKARRRIPLNQIDPQWRSGAIGEDIQRFAPQILDQEPITTLS